MKKSMQVKRKRIWDVDCEVVDAVLFLTFDWKELFNLLQSQGVALKEDEKEAANELKAYVWVHKLCHNENPVSLKIEHWLNQWTHDVTRVLDRLNVNELHEYVMNMDFAEMRDCLRDVLWSLGTDDRRAMGSISKTLLMRYKLYRIRGV